jgi:hypothetical protein
VTYATVTGHEPFSSDANQAEYWGETCEKIVDGGSLSSYVLTEDYALVVVKSAASNVDPYTNTLFEDASAGETVWADTNGNFTYDPGGQNGDKEISHIIVCEGEGETSSSAPATPSEPVTTSPAPTTSAPSTTPPSTTSTPPPTETETTESVSPSTSISTSSTPPPSSASPTTETPSSEFSTKESGSKPEQTKTKSESAAPAQLANTGSDLPVTGAIGISLLLIGLGALLMLGPGRLIPSYHRKH